MTLLQHRSLSARLRSGLFAFVFAPIALVFLGSSMVDVQALAAVGQPLDSSAWRSPPCSWRSLR